MASYKTINFLWFKKPMATSVSILTSSAMLAATKRITLMQRGITMLQDTRRKLHDQLLIPLMEQIAPANPVPRVTAPCASQWRAWEA